ncbi:MAG: AMP-binding protein [Actinomycetota bacterium]
MTELRSGDLVAIQAPPGPAWEERLIAAWEAGAAVMPIDHRLGSAAVAEVIGRARPTVVESADSSRQRLDGSPVQDGIGLAIATSGSTGTPATVLLGRSALETAVKASADRLELNAEPWVCSLPVSHIGGMLVVLRRILLGLEVIYSPDPLMARDGWASIVPTQLARMTTAGTDLRGHRFLVGGAALAPGLRQSAEDLGARVVHTYGMTETSGGVVYDGLPLNGVDIRIGAASRIELKTPTSASSIRRASGDVPLATHEGWFTTRDTGHLEEGRLVVTGRMDAVINSGGEKIDPAAVEAALTGLPAVRAATVFSVADEEWGARMGLRIDADMTDQEIADFLRSSFGPATKPVIIERTN